MDFTYGEYNGTPFPDPESLFARPEVIQFILMYGQEGLDALSETEEQQHQQLIEEMLAAGLLEKDEESGTLRITPKLVQGIEHRSLLDIFENLKKGPREGHESREQGRGDERREGSKPYQFGDKLSDLDMIQTMRNAIQRQHRQGTAQPIGPPLSLQADDLEIHHTEGRADTALCLLIDLSGSMMRYRRFLHAKRVALGMAGLMRRMFPQDTLDYVGFYSLADAISEQELPLIMPKPVTIFDYQVRIRMPLEQAQQQPEKIPQHFTNLHLGLRKARQLLRRRGATNKQMFIITDGQPTAHVESNESGGEMLYLLYPPSDRTSTVTLKEALRCYQEGIQISTFALLEDYWGMDWVGFVDQMTRLVRGAAFYCSSDDLSSTVFESYLSGKKRRAFIH